MENDLLHNRNSYSCPQCGHTFMGAQAMAAHLVSHHSIAHRQSTMFLQLDPPPPRRLRVHVCPTCSKDFKKPSDLVRHQRIHTGLLPQQCCDCRIGEKPFVCRLCDRSFRLRSTLYTHMKTHEDASETLLCSLCPRTYLTMSALKLHLRHHTGERPLACPYSECSNTFRCALVFGEEVL